MQTSLSKTRIKKVFEASLKNIVEGRAANVQGEVLKAGYSPSYAKNELIKKTKTWKECMAKVDDEGLIDELLKVAYDQGDKRPKLQAIDMLLKLKDKYPAGRVKFGEISDEDKRIFE